MCIMTMAGHSNFVRGPIFSPDGETILSGSGKQKELVLVSYIE